MTSITRRDFLKGCAATLAAAAVVNKGLSGVFEATAANEPSAEWKPAFCGFCHFPCCATQVRVVDGVAVEIRGDKASESNKGKLCVRGLSAIGNLYHAYRVKAPMKRTNPEKKIDNDPGWVEITWEEAFSTVAAKLKEAMEYDPASILCAWGFGVEESFHSLPVPAFGFTVIESPGTLCPEHFNQLHLNGQMLDRIDLEHCEYIVEIGRTMGSDWVTASATHTNHYADSLENKVKHVVINPYCNHAAQRGEWVPIMPGTDTALGLAMLYVMLYEIKQIDEWSLKTHTNAPYLIDDKVVTLKGRTVHQGDYVLDEDGKPLVWDTAQNMAVPHDSSKGLTYALFGDYPVNGKRYKTSLQVLKDFVKEYTPEWQEEYTTIPAAKVREITSDLVKHARIGSTIEIDGYTFPYRPSAIFMGRGIASHMLGVSAAKALGTVNLLLGNLDVPGGIQGCCNANHYTLHADEYGIMMARGLMQKQVQGVDFEYPPKNVGMDTYYPSGHNSIPAGWRAMKDPASIGLKHGPKFWIAHGSDLLGSSSNTPEAQEIMASIPFMVSIAYQFDICSQFCDVLFADNSLLERDAIYRMYRNEKEADYTTIGLNGTLVREPVVEKVYNTMLSEDIWFELLDRLHLTAPINEILSHADLYPQVQPSYAVALTPENFLPTDRKITWREFIEAKIKSDFGPDAIADFKAHAFKPSRLPLKESYNYWYIPEDKVRLPVYYQRMVRNGAKFKQQLAAAGVSVPGQDMDHVFSHYSGMPVWYPEGLIPPTAEYPFKVVNWKVHYGVNNTGGLYENAYMQDIIDHCNPNVKAIQFPASRAAEYGLKEGDRIRIESNYGGVTEGRIHLSQFMHPQCIGIPGNFGRRTKYMNPLKDPGVNFNTLLSFEAETLNPLSVSLESSPTVKITKI